MVRYTIERFICTFIANNLKRKFHLIRLFYLGVTYAIWITTLYLRIKTLYSSKEIISLHSGVCQSALSFLFVQIVIIMKSLRFNLFVTFCVIATIFEVCPLKFHDISDCRFFDRGASMGNDNLTFICDESKREQSVFLNATLNCTNYKYRIGHLWPGTINFDRCSFAELKRNFFQEFPYMHTFIISNTELETLQKSIFNDAKNVSTLIASHNRIVEIPALVFVNAHKFLNMDFSSNSIKRVDSLAFVGTNNLQSLDLSNNNITELDEQVLKLLTNLIKLNLSHNQFGLLNSRMLPVPTVLELDLSSNKLTALENHAFDKLLHLQLLNLSFNPIGNLSAEIFAYLTELKHLNLKQINISHFQMGTFSHQHNLVSLDLSENQLKKLDFKLFFPILNDLKSFRIANNQLTDLSGLNNPLFPKLNLLDIKNNPFNCSYLEHFMGSINWEKIRLSIDPHSVDLQHESSIRGIKCEVTNQTYSSNGEIHSACSFSHHTSNGDIFTKLLLTIICVVMLVYFIIFLAMNRKKMYGQLFASTLKYPENLLNTQGTDNPNAEL